MYCTRCGRDVPNTVRICPCGNAEFRPGPSPIATPAPATFASAVPAAGQAGAASKYCTRCREKLPVALVTCSCGNTSFTDHPAPPAIVVLPPTTLPATVDAANAGAASKYCTHCGNKLPVALVTCPCGNTSFSDHPAPRAIVVPPPALAPAVVDAANARAASKYCTKCGRALPVAVARCPCGGSSFAGGTFAVWISYLRRLAHASFRRSAPTTAVTGTRMVGRPSVGFRRCPNYKCDAKVPAAFLACPKCGTPFSTPTPSTKLIELLRPVRRHPWISAAAACMIALFVLWVAAPRPEFALGSNVSAVAITYPGFKVTALPAAIISEDPIAFDVDPDGVPVVAARNALWAVGPGVIRRLFHPGFLPKASNIEDVVLEDFAFADDGALFVVAKDSSQRRLYIDDREGLRIFVDFSADGIRAANPLGIYLFTGNYVHLLVPGPQKALLARLPERVVAVAGDGVRTFIATQRTVYLVAFKQVPSIFFETTCDILSLAVADDSGVFYSTKCGVGYVDDKGRTPEFVRNGGGQIRVRGSALYLWSRGQNAVIRFSPVSALSQR